MSIQVSNQSLTVGQTAHALAAQRPPLPLRTCGFCDKDLPWGAATSVRYGDEMHAVCATAFDEATHRMRSQAARLGYTTGECSWCRRDASTLRSITMPFDALVCAGCRGVRAGEVEG